MLLSNAVQATQIELGQIDFTGNFTLNHNYNFNDRAAFPFGTFGIQTVQDATGIFAPYVVPGSTLGMNPQFMYGVITQSLSMTWSIGGFTFDTQETNIAGADFVGRYCDGFTDLSGNGFDPSAYEFGTFSFWHFRAPPYDISNFHHDITGPIDLTFIVGYDNGHVPDPGTTVMLLGIALAGIGLLRRKIVT